MERHVGGDIGEHGGLVEERTEVRAGLAAGEHARALGDGVLDVLGDLLQLRGRGEGADLGPVLLLRAEPQRRHPCGEAIHERGGDRLIDVDALDRDAQLAGVGEAAGGGAVDHAVEVGVGGDEHGVLAAELGREADEALGRALGDGAACGGGPGEHDVVGGLDDRRAHRGAGPGDDLHQALGKTGLFEELVGAQRGERGLGVGLDHDAVAGDEGGEGVRDGEDERVVPGRDDADDALGDVVLLRGHQAGGGGHAAGGLEGARGEAGVVPGRHGLVHDLLERPDPGLAVLGLDEVEELVLVVEHEVVVAEQDGGALLDGQLRPAALHAPALGDGGLDVLAGADGHLADHLASERGGDRLGLPARGAGDAGGEPIGLGPAGPQRGAAAGGRGGGGDVGCGHGVSSRGGTRPDPNATPEGPRSGRAAGSSG